ncbi:MULTISPECIES: hypothetical protein [Candidatus Williamhamiltonella]|uniref:Uncharacterized protein n=1 Tax=Candidatus Williamhamiltonella defendens TaxID=138072 RepID=A0A2D3TEZ6_9ENTR|nr:hypothetical protein [Candidatus Hamiltonella defensa]ATW34365.1 hypothetical protein BJP43_08980 [Candidatus Hamiltonella defensa]
MHLNPSTSNQPLLKKDDKVYNDSKGRPVGIATQINKVTNCVTDPKTDPTKIPPMTPEDKRKMDELFNRCFAAGEALLTPKK